jgi:hypothetical protein
MKKTELGVCPKCGSDDIEYLELNYEGEYVIHECLCNDCDFGFQEYERLSYDGYSYNDEDGKFYDFDANGDRIGK